MQILYRDSDVIFTSYIDLLWLYIRYSYLIIPVGSVQVVSYCYAEEDLANNIQTDPVPSLIKSVHTFFYRGQREHWLD